jgi:hypothetical protein
MWTERAPEHVALQKIFPRVLALATVLWSSLETKARLPFSEFHRIVSAVHIPRRLKRMHVGTLSL